SIVDSGISGYGQTLRLTVAGIGDTGNPGEPGDNTVPEPASGLLIGLGGLAMLMLRRRSPRISLA
ncbi:PEP-CTERM sorting domain-containing protein, partial [Nitrosomonas europaea]